MLWGVICERCHAYHSKSRPEGLTCRVERHHSTGDQRYRFVTQHLKPGTEIRSKGQWQRFLKANHMTDDLTMKELRDLGHTTTLQERLSRQRWERTKQDILPHIERAAHQFAPRPA